MTTPRSRRSAAVADTTRTSSDDRDVVVGLLNDAYSLGRLEPDEYQARLDLAMRPGTYTELYRALDDGRGGRSTGVTVVPGYEVPTQDQLRVKVETEGSWTITLRDVGDAPALGPAGSGTGYVVGWYDGPEGVFSMSADEGNFAVWDDWRLVVNGIGPERDEGIVEAGRRLLRIESAAPWRYEIR